MATLYVKEGKALRAADVGEILHQAKTLLARRLRPGSPVLDRPEVVRSFTFSCISLLSSTKSSP